MTQRGTGWTSVFFDFAFLLAGLRLLAVGAACPSLAFRIDVAVVVWVQLAILTVTNRILTRRLGL
jgi:hypothetical protein